MSLEGIHFWHEVLNALSIKLKNPVFKQWMNITSAKYDMSKGLATITAPNNFIKERLVGYTSDIEDLLSQIMCVKARVEIITNKADSQKDGTEPKNSPEDLIIQTHTKRNKSNFIPRFTFESFVVGSNNQFAHASCLSVAARPSKSYNPLVIFGNSGLGKTHLLHAIGNYICEYFNDLKVIYINGERFLNEYIKALRTGTIDAFRKKFREEYDVILIDDVQFIAGKGKSQEELFHTLSAVRDNNKQIVIASDKFPDEIEGLDKRLKTRFSSGLICDIKAPELETRVAIITAKAKELNIGMSQDSAVKLAELFQNNIRELEGAVTSVGAFASFANTQITPDFINEIFSGKNLSIKEKSSIDVNKIIKRVAMHFDISSNDILGADRKKESMLPRHIAIYIAKQLTHKSLTELATLFKKKNHSTIIHACEKIEEVQKHNSKLKNDIDHIISDIKNS